MGDPPGVSTSTKTSVLVLMSAGAIRRNGMRPPAAADPSDVAAARARERSASSWFVFTPLEKRPYRAKPNRTRARATTAAPKRASLSRRDKSAFLQRIAGPADGVQEPRLAGVLQLLPEGADVDGDHVVRLGLASPNGVQKLFARKHLARVAEEVLQKVELGRRQRDGTGTAPGAAGGRLQRQVGEAKVVGGPCPTEQRSPSSQELLVREGLHEVVVGAAVETLDSLFGAAKSCEQQDWEPSGRAEAAADCDSVQSRKHHVQHDQIRRVFASPTQSLQPIPGELDLVTFSLEHALQRGRQAAVIFDHENPGGGHSQRYISRL